MTEEQREIKRKRRVIEYAIGRELNENAGLIDRFRHVAVLGYGPVGAAVTAELRRLSPNLKVDVVDPDGAKHEDIRAAGARPLVELPERLDDTARYDVVTGCTGYNSFKLHQRRLLAEKAILASGSSAAVEFNRAGFIELADAFPADEIEVLNRAALSGENIHATVSLTHEGGRVMHFLNAGFPVNFDGRMECLPTRMIQPTHCLLFHAGRQILRAGSPGVHPFNAEVDAWLLENAPAGLENAA